MKMEAYQQILNDIERIREDHPLAPIQPVRLMAVTKTISAEQIIPLLEAGHRLFGENRVQEAAAKYPDLIARYPDIELHLIGPLQTNKLKAALDLFHTIQTVDRPSLRDKLLTMKQQNPEQSMPELYIQVNIGDEPQKSGISTKEAPNFIEETRAMGLSIKGLMAIPPMGVLATPYFALLKKLADQYGITELSMGMSGDYDKAITVGATLVRVGSALFGERKT